MVSGIALALTLALAPATEEDLVVAKALYEKGSEYLESGEYQKAATLFAELYDRTGDPWALYNRAQAERLAGKCDQAVPLYRAFLGSDGLDDRDRFHATKNIERCGGDPTPLPPGAAAATATTVPEPQSQPEEPPKKAEEKKSRRKRMSRADDEQLDSLPPPRLDESAAPAPPSMLDEDRPPTSKVVRDPVGWSLLGLGVVGISIGVPFQVIGGRDADEAQGDDTEAEYVVRVKDGRRQQAVGSALLATGSVLAVAGIVRFAVMAARAKKAKRATGLAVRF
jgi:tetratricopeptide (TPR) repeat protein